MVSNTIERRSRNLIATKTRRHKEIKDLIVVINHISSWCLGVLVADLFKFSCKKNEDLIDNTYRASRRRKSNIEEEFTTDNHGRAQRSELQTSCVALESETI